MESGSENAGDGGRARGGDEAVVGEGVLHGESEMGDGSVGWRHSMTVGLSKMTQRSTRALRGICSYKICAIQKAS